MENADTNASRSNTAETPARGSKLSTITQLTTSVVAVGALILSIATWRDQRNLTKTQNDFAKEQNRLTEKQNSISQKQEEIASREATPSGVDWGLSSWTAKDGRRLVDLKVWNREEESVDAVTLSVHATDSEGSTIKKNFRFQLLDSCTRESITVSDEYINDSDGSTFTLSFKDFTDQFWSRGQGPIKKAKIVAPNPGLDETVDSEVESDIC